MREAASRSSEFSEAEHQEDHGRAWLGGSMFIDTLAMRRESTGHVRDTLHGLAEHARNSGTAVGRAYGMPCRS